MTDPSSIQLMYSVVDGEATPAEETALRELLAASGEARAHFAEITELAGLLDSACAQDLEPELVEEVLAGLRSRADNLVYFRSPSADSSALAAAEPSVHRSRRRMRFTAVWAAAALGLAVLASVPVLTSRMARIEPRDAAGSIRTTDTRAWPETGRFASTGAEATLVIRTRGNLIAVLPSVEAEGERQIALRWDGEQLNLLEFSPQIRQNVTHNNQIEAAVTGGAVSPVLILEKRAGGKGSVPVVLSIDGRDVVTAWIPMD